MDSYDAWHIPYDYNENVKEVDLENEHEHDVYLNNMDTSSS
jgi:hypothetical protein